MCLLLSREASIFAYLARNFSLMSRAKHILPVLHNSNESL